MNNVYTADMYCKTRKAVYIHYMVIQDFYAPEHFLPETTKDLCRKRYVFILNLTITTEMSIYLK